MRESIEEERKKLEKGLVKSTHGSLSYIKYLTRPNNSLHPENAQALAFSTINLLYYINDAFNKANKQIIKKLGSFEAELRNRKDIDQAIMQFLQHTDVQDKFYYWIPGVKIDNIFTLLNNVRPNFGEKYKKYYMECRTLRKAYLNCNNFIKQFYTKIYKDIKIIERDLELFENCVSASYWINEYAEYNGEIPGIEKTIDLGENIYGEIVPDLSYVEITIGEGTMLVTVRQLMDLNMKREEGKEFWVQSGVIDENFEFLG